KHNPKFVTIPKYLPDTWEVRHDIAQYHDKIQKLDEQIGSILQELENEGLKENTIIFYFSDHGGVLPRSKRFVYDSGLKIPLIIYIPNAYKDLMPGNPGSIIDQIVTQVDFIPTILKLA